MDLFQKFLAALLFPLSVLVCLVLLVISSILWIPYLIALAIDKILGKEQSEFVSAFEEFIFACYGFAALMIYLPLSAFEEELY